MKERTTTTWTLWAVVLLALVGVVPEVSADLDLGMCQSTCSAVPQDLWPYCCETHHTCCEEFADSCIHDCLPRVSSGDVSAVEERPGLCCALYNLCCFRETPRISSIRSQDVQQPQSFPITHRFSTLPGGPGRNRQSSVTVPKVAQTAAPAPVTTTFSKPKVSNENRRPTSINRPKPARNPPSSFRDTPRSETSDDVFDNKNTDDNNLGHRFDVQDPSTERPSQFQNSPNEEEETNAFNRPLTPSRPQKLIKLARPVSPSPSESQNKDTPDIQEQLESNTNIITPKTLDRPRPGSAFRPTNPRQLSNPEPEVPEIPEEEPKQEQINPTRPSFLNRSLQQRKLSLTNPSDQSPPEEEQIQSQPKEERRSNKLFRTGPLIRSGVNRENSKPVSEVTEQPEQFVTIDVETSRGPKLLRPKIKPFRPGKKDTEGSDVSPQADQEQDQVVLDSNLNQQTLKEEASAFLKVDSAIELPEKPTEPKAIRSGSPIRKIKLIRPRENNKNQQPNHHEQAVTEVEPKEIQQIAEGTTVVPPTTRSQVTSGRSRNIQRTAATNPQGTQGRTVTSTQASQGRSRGRTRFTEESSVDNTQESVRGTSRSTSTQAGSSRGGASSARGRTRTRSRPEVTEPAIAVESQATKKPTVLSQESAKLPSIDIENEEMLKEHSETIADVPLMNDEKIMEQKKEMEKIMEDDVLNFPKNVNNNENIVSTGAPVVPEEKSMHEQEKIALPKKTQDVSELPSEDQKSYLPEKSSLTEEETDTEKMADQLSALGQSPKLVPSPRQNSEPHASDPITEPELPKVTSQQQIPRVTSQPQEPVQSQEEQQFSRQRSETQTASRQRSNTQAATRQSTNPSSGQTATRSRGRLTARDRLALSNSAN